jgi:hypothetical protein
VSALLARDRLRQLQPGRFSYSSRPFRLLRFELVPSVEILAVWEGGELRLRCSDSRIVGLGRLERALRFALSASLRPAPKGIDGLARVSLALRPGLPAWAYSLAGNAPEQVLDRVERRLVRGLRKDLLTLLLDPQSQVNFMGFLTDLGSAPAGKRVSGRRRDGIKGVSGWQTQWRVVDALTYANCVLVSAR